MKISPGKVECKVQSRNFLGLGRNVKLTVEIVNGPGIDFSFHPNCSLRSTIQGNRHLGNERGAVFSPLIREQKQKKRFVVYSIVPGGADELSVLKLSI